MSRTRFDLELYRVIRIIDEKGYCVIPFKFKDKYKVQIYFNGQFLKEGALLFDTFDDCLEASYRTLLKIT